MQQRQVALAFARAPVSASATTARAPPHSGRVARRARRSVIARCGSPGRRRALWRAAGAPRGAWRSSPGAAGALELIAVGAHRLGRQVLGRRVEAEERAEAAVHGGVGAPRLRRRCRAATSAARAARPAGSRSWPTTAVSGVAAGCSSLAMTSKGAAALGHVRELPLSPPPLKLSTTSTNAPRRRPPGAAMFTMSITSTTSSKAGFSARIGLFVPRAALGSARRIHVNDANPQCWHVVYTGGGT